METTAEELEGLAAILLRSNNLEVSELASDNLFSAITKRLLVIEPEAVQTERIEQSITAGRKVMELVGAVA